MMTMRSWGRVPLLAVPLLAALLGLGGCVQVEQTLTLNADGSGTLAMRYGMAEQTIAQLRAMQQLAAPDGDGVRMQQETPFEFDPEQVRAEFEADKPDGVELEALSSELVDGWKFIDLALRFDDIRQLKRSELFADSRLAIEPLGDGRYRITQRAGGGDGQLAGEDPDPQLVQQLRGMLAGLRIVQTLVVPGDIVETNAPQVQGRRASWVFDIAQDSDVIRTLADTDLELVFAGGGLSLPAVAP